MATRKYYPTRAQAAKALAERKQRDISCIDKIYCMPRYSRHHGQYGIMTEMEYIHGLFA